MRKTMDILFGSHAVEALLKAENMQKQKLYVEHAQKSQYKQIIQKASSLKWPIEYSKDLNSLFSGKRHQGIAASFQFKWGEISDVVHKPDATLLMLDRIQDPHNFGACLRSAAAFGVDAIIIPKRGGCPLTDTVHQVSCGGSVIVPIIQVNNLNQIISELKDQGVWFIATDEHATSAINQIDTSGKKCLVMGSEGLGVKQSIKDACDYKVAIPTSKQLSTLNVSVATGILLYSLYSN